MDNRFKAIITNKRLFKEIDLPSDKDTFRIGTTKSCDIRFSKELFFTDFEILFENQSNVWTISCDDNIFISLDGIIKLVHKELSHGDTLIIKYHESKQEVFRINYVFDFDSDNKNYDRIIDINGCASLQIGGSSNCDIQIHDPLIGFDSITLFMKNGHTYIQDNQTKYGLYVNGCRQSGQAQLFDYDFFSIVGFSFYYKYGKLYTSSSDKIAINGLKFEDVLESKTKLKYPRFNRSTRIRPVIPTDKISVLDPPAEPTKPKSNIVMQLLPVLGMLAVTVVLRGAMPDSGGGFVIFSVCSMGVGVITSAASIVGDRRRFKKDIVQRKEKYLRYISNKKAELAECRREELEILDELYYPVPRAMQFVSDFSNELFNRAQDDEDFLNVRIGTGAVLSARPIDYKAQEKFEGDDELANLPEQLSFGYQYITGAPIVIDLKANNAVGVVGDDNKLSSLMRIITADISIRQYFSDIKLFYLVNEEKQHLVSSLRLLPHLQNNDLGIRNIICDDESKNILFEYLYRELSQRETQKTVFPRIIIFVLSDLGIKRHPLSQFIEKAQSCGVTFIFFENHVELLPSGCDTVVQLSDTDTSGVVLKSKNSTDATNFSYDAINDRDISHIVDRLAPIYCEEVSLEGSLTKNISFFELLNILTVEDLDLHQRWSSSRVYDSMAAPLGVKSKNEIVCLDLNEKHHGPHGLVAGTTGSGKSEVLQSYILSMATLFHPYEVGFVIIDFKGGGMVNQFKELPHLIGAITNIDGREINRSLLSIKAELRKRQELFAQAGVNHIDAYIKLYKNNEVKIPLPHLILIVDEFAELKMDQPEFMKELISAARIGRSLGVHLILATQKPSGVVDAQIWSNSKFRLCLKVQNKEDSNEVLKTPLAAEIKEPGRAYLQVGNNEIFDLFQSAYSGAPANQDASVSQKQYEIYSVSLWGRRTPVYIKKPDKQKNNGSTQLDATIEYISDHCIKTHISRLPGICLPPLEDYIDYPEAVMMKDPLRTIVPLGVFDDPNNQRQDIVYLDLSAGHTMIVGSSLYGKTSLLQVVIRGIADYYSPQEVSLYILDFGSMALKVFDSLAHVGGVAVPSEDEKLKNFIRMIKNEIVSRKEAFSRLGITSFVSYREAGHQDLPHNIIMMDNFIAVRELYPDYEDDLLYFCREGVAVGISMVVTSLQTSGISYRYMSNFSNRIGLFCNQSDEYGTLFDRCRMEPKNVPGRGLISIDKTVYEYQTYIGFKGEKEIDRVSEIKAYIQSVANKYTEQHAVNIPEVPQILDMNYLSTNYKHVRPYQIPVGIDYDTVNFVTVNLNKVMSIAITGRENSGKTNLVRIFMKYFEQNALPMRAYLVDDFDKQLSEFASLPFVMQYTSNPEDLKTTLHTISEELDTRLEKVHDKGYEVLSDEPLLLCVVQNSSLFSSGGSGDAAADMLNNILKNYRQLKFCIIFASIENVNVNYNSPELLRMSKDSNHIFVCDDLANLKLVDLNGSSARQYKKPIDLGDAYMMTEKGIQKLKTIYI